MIAVACALGGLCAWLGLRAWRRRSRWDPALKIGTPRQLWDKDGYVGAPSRFNGR